MRISGALRQIQPTTSSQRKEGAAISGGAKKIIIALSVVIATILFAVPMAGTADAGSPRDYVGDLYTMTNDASGNEVIMFHRTSHGLLVPGGTFSTGGMGSGGGLGNQGALFLSKGGRLLFVSEATTGSMSSYLLEDDGILQVVSSAVPTTEVAACWVVITTDGRFAYTTNTGSGTVSGFRIFFDGTITLLDTNGVTGNTGDGPIDMALSNNDRFLFTLNSGDDTISSFKVHADGSLSPLPGASGLPGGTNGLAAR